MKNDNKPESDESLCLYQANTSCLYRTSAELLGFSLTFVLPEAEIVQCRPTEQGFYCDFLVKQPVDDHVIKLVEENLRGLIKQELPIKEIEMMRENASQFLLHQGQGFKVKDVLSSKSNIVSLFQIDDYTSFSVFSLLSNTEKIGFIHLFHVEEVEIFLEEVSFLKVKRLFGTASQDKRALKRHVKSLEAAKKSQFSAKPPFDFLIDISENGYVFSPSGVKLKENLVNWWKKELSELKFEFLSTPSLVKYELILNSGYNESYPLEVEPEIMTIQEEEYLIPPTFTPVHAAVFKDKQSFYFNKPCRFAECKEIIPLKSDLDLKGMESSKLVTADFAHIFCESKDLTGELISSLQFIDRTITMFGFKCQWILHDSLRKKLQSGEKSSLVSRWNEALKSFEQAFESCGKEFVKIIDGKIVSDHQIQEKQSQEISQDDDLLEESVEEESKTESVMLNGPKIEAQIVDSFGRHWSGPSIELDLYLAKRLGISVPYEGNKRSFPVVIRMSIFGSLERFIALLLENYRGVLPLWLRNDNK